MDDFERELAENLKRMQAARMELLGEVRGLGADDMNRVRRGGWPVREVLRHLIDSEVAYTKVIGFLRGNAVDLENASEGDVASGQAAAEALERARKTMLGLIEGVDETTFYDLRALGKEQYSVVSVLENVAAHDHEHTGQIAKTLAAQ